MATPEKAAMTAAATWANLAIVWVEMLVLFCKTDLIQDGVEGPKLVCWMGLGLDEHEARGKRANLYW